jgi:hypothetical protein
MFVGHYGPAFVARGLAPAVPLWVAFLAVQTVDVIWAGLVLAGVEKVRIVPGITASNPLDLYYMPWTHSLPAAAAWAAVTAVVVRLAVPRAGWRSAGVLGAAAFSHWLLDLLVHRPDLPLYDNHLKVGLGLWNFPLPAFLLEVAVFAAGFAFWVARSRPGPRLVRSVAVLGLVMVAVHAWAFFGRPPGTGTEAALLGLLAFLGFPLVVGRLERNPG